MERGATRGDGPIRDPGRLGIGDHACWAYASDAEHQEILSGYLSAGLRAGERLVFLGAQDGYHETVRGALGAGGHDVDRLLAEGRLILGTAEDSYLSDGTFDADARVADYRAMVRRAVDDGYPGLRVAAETNWLLETPHALKTWPTYEFRAEILARRIPFSALCCYDARAWPADELAMLRSLHGLDVRMRHPEEAAGFHLRARSDGGIAVAGELDVVHAELVCQVLTACGEETGAPVLDLTGLRFADVAAMRALAHGARTIARAHGHVALLDGPPILRRLWRLLELDRLVPESHWDT